MVIISQKTIPQSIYGSRTISTPTKGRIPTGIGILLKRVFIVGNIARNTTEKTPAIITDMKVPTFPSYTDALPLKYLLMPPFSFTNLNLPLFFFFLRTIFFVIVTFLFNSFLNSLAVFSGKITS